jgi:hypothetical protein
MIYTILCNPATQVDVKVHHVLSVEVEEFKREFIMAAHTRPGEKHEFCMFDDVAVLDQESAFYYTCQKTRSTHVTCDVFFSSPSCKGISYENPKRAKWASCYTNHEGCSGHTYRYGFKKGIEVTCPAVGFFENTKGVADSVKDEYGVKQPPRIEAMGCKLFSIYLSFFYIFIDIYIYLYICLLFECLNHKYIYIFKTNCYVTKNN